MAARGAQEKRRLPGASEDVLDTAVLTGHLGSSGWGGRGSLLIPSTCVRMLFSPAASRAASSLPPAVPAFLFSKEF